MAKDKVSPKEAAVRDAAANLLTAISEARAAGYAVTLPSRIEDLGSIDISATGSVRQDGEQPDTLTPVNVEGRQVFGDAPTEGQ